MSNTFHENLLSIFILLSVIFLTNNLIGQTSNKIIVGDKARFTVISTDCIRMEYSENGKFIDEPSLFAANRNIDFNNFSVKNKDGKTVIRTQRVTLAYKPNGKPFSAENLEAFFMRGRKRVKWTFALKNKNNLGGTLRTLDQVKGKVPLDDGLLSRDGWFILDDSKRPILTADWVASRPEGSGIDWYLFAYGKDFKAGLKSLTKISGEVPLPRKYALGSWYSRYWPYSSKDYHQIVDEYKKYDFPLDIMVMDMDWHREGWTGWSWNRELLPDAEDLLKWFHQTKLFVTLNVHPSQGIMPHEDMYKSFMKDMGVNLNGIPKDKLPTLPYDASDKKYLDNLFKNTHLPLEKEGVDFWWLDWQQFEYTLGNKDLRNLEWLNRYYFNYSKKNGERGLSFSRWGGWGDQKYPIHFSGDASTSWEMLEFEVPFTSTAGNVGCFFWSHDIGGHMGGINPETNARWVQFGATTAALRLHSTRDKTMDKRPWLFEDKYLQSMKIAFHLRSELFPYIYSSAWQSCKESIPLNRPMYIEYPLKEDAYHQPQQYLFGDAFLVAPITHSGIGKNNLADQKVWFPKGTWYNWFTGEKFVGDEKIKAVWSDIYEFPFYAKGGYPVAMQPFTQRMTTDPLKRLVIRVYPGPDNKSCESTLYEDDGISQEYTKGKYATTKIQYSRKGDEYKIIINPVNGEYKGQLKKRSYQVEFPCLEKSINVVVNDRAVHIEYDSTQFVNKINIKETSIKNKLEIRLVSKEADNALIHSKAEQNKMIGVQNEKDLNKLGMETIDKTTGANLSEEANGELISLLSGVSVFIEDAGKITVLKDMDSKTDAKFSLLVFDEIGLDKKNVHQEDFNLKPGESKIVSLESLKANNQPVTRKMLVKFSLNGNEMEIPGTIDKKLPYIYNWNIIGPFDYDPSKKITDFVYEPEKEINISASYKGKDNKIVGWKEVTNNTNPVFDFNNYFAEENSIAYAFVNIKSDNEQEIFLNISSDDGVEVWLNKEKIHSNNTFRGVEPEVDKVKAKLIKGENLMLVKISQGTGGWAFRVNYECQYPIEIHLK
jgi:alpha-glucosidase (family GH31 glycosyl hydrolase)